jgi:tetratricopeptide (TPR) repeat protein
VAEWTPGEEQIDRAWRTFGLSLEQELLAMGWIDADRLRTLKAGKPAAVELGPYLVEAGAISAEQLAQIAPRETFYFCTSCSRRICVRGAAPGGRYRCPACGTPVAEEMGALAVIAEQAQFEEEPLPEEAREAARDPSNQFGRFVKLALAGQGGMGTVWKCFDRQLKRTVAVKFLEGVGELTVERFLREAKVTARLEHPHIARVYDSGIWQGRPYIVMQFVEGRTLAPNMKLIDLLNAIAQAARAVHHAHELGFVHRDIKPENIMATSQGEVFVLDFGLARDIAGEGAMSRSGAVMGTPAYMSPEQIRGESSRIDCRSDVYSLGATLYSLVAGRPPFEGRGLADMIPLVTEKDPAPPGRWNKEVSRDLETLILKAMEKEPARRYPSARALAEDIDRFLSGRPVLAHRAGPFYKLKKLIRRQPGYVTAVAIALLALMLLASYSLGIHVRDQQHLDRLLTEGRVKLQANELRSAHEALVKAAEIDPDRAAPLLQEASRRLARLSSQEEERARVDPLLRRLREIDRLATRTDPMPSLTEALQESDRLAQWRPDWAGAWLARGWSNRLMSKFKGPLNHLESALQDLDNSVRFARQSAVHYLAESLYQRALARLERTLFQGTDREGVLISSEEALTLAPMRFHPDDSASKSIELGRQDLKDARRAGSEDPGFAYAESLIEYLGGNFQAVIDRLDRPDSLGSIQELLLKARASFIGLGRTSYLDDVEMAARSRWRDAVELAGLMKSTARDFDKAAPYYDQLIELDPSSARAWRRRGALWVMLRKLDEALEDLDKAIGLDPLDAGSYMIRGDAHKLKKDLHQAIRDYSKAIELNSNYTSAYFLRAHAHHAKGELKSAVDDMAKATALAPAVPDYHRDLSKFLVEAGDYARAESHLNRAIELKPDWTLAYFNRYQLHAFLAGARPADALKHLRNAEVDLNHVLKAAPPDWPKRQEAEAALSQLKVRIDSLEPKY